MMQGALSGAGLQKVTAASSLVAWYLIGAPLACGLIWGLQLDMAAGDVLLLSCAAAMLAAFAGQAVALLRHDWRVSVDAAAARLDQTLAESADARAAASSAFQGPRLSLPIVIAQPTRRAKSLSPKTGSPGSAFGISPLPPHPFSFVVSSNIHLHFSPPQGQGLSVLAPRCPASACLFVTGGGAEEDEKDGPDAHGRCEGANAHGEDGPGTSDAGRGGLQEPLLLRGLDS